MADESAHGMPLGLRGTSYEDTIPDTLDLAQRAELGLNYFTEIIEEQLGYEMPFHVWYNQYS
jgi:hypothetical protein